MTQCLNNGISFNPKKCAFCVNSWVLLGHVVCEDGLLVDPKKIIITNMPTLISVTELKRFFNATCFYWQYFKDFDVKTTPMCKLLKNDIQYWWDETYKQSFQWMKTSLTTLLVFIVHD